MKVIHLYTPKRGVRFYSKVKGILKSSLEKVEYTYFTDKKYFFEELSRELDEYDVVLILAHGAEDSIIVPRPYWDALNHDTQYKRYIFMEDTDKLKRDFVFSVACCTAMEFGPKAIENGALSYLGYDIGIERIFSVQDLKIAKKVRKFYELQIKKIFVEELADAINRFIYEFHSVNMLKQNFLFRLEKRLICFFNMTAQEIREEYNYGIDENIWNKEKPKLRMLQLNFLDELGQHMIICGDPNYIPIVGFSQKIKMDKDIMKRLELAHFEDKQYEKEFHNLFKELVQQ